MADLPSFKHNPLTNQCGQSTTEYVVIILFMLFAFMGKNAITEQLQTTFHNKYKSYAFGVAISDPPSKAFDDEVKDKTDRVKTVIDSLKNIIDIISDFFSGDIDPGTDPGTEIIEQFKHIIEQFKP